MAWGALAAGITATGQMLINAYNKRQSERNYEKQLADQRQNWYMQNAYNSPGAQMERLKSAGLNPSLIYQNGGAVQPASLPEGAELPFTPWQDNVGVVSQGIAADLAQAEIDRKTAETDALKENNRLSNTPLGKLQEWNIMNREFKESFARLFGLQVNEMDGLSMNFMTHKSQLEQVAGDSKYIREMLDVIKHTKTQAEAEAIQAKFMQYIAMMQFETEAETRGYDVYKAQAGSPSKTGEPEKPDDGKFYGLPSGVWRNKNKLNYVAQLVLQEYYSSEYENRSLTRGIRAFGDISGGVGSVIPSFGKLFQRNPSPNISNPRIYNGDFRRKR